MYQLTHVMLLRDFALIENTELFKKFTALPEL